MAFSRLHSLLKVSLIPRMPVILWIVVVLGILAGMACPRPVSAQTSEEGELIELINALRASRGLAAYTVDPALMAIAQEHSAYQASIHTSTHLHSDGRNPPQLGVVENVAGGDLGYITPYNAVYDIWVMDAGHLRTMVGFASGAMGVGIADDGETAYYTLEVRTGATMATAISTGEAGAGSTLPAATPLPIVPLVTATAGADGTIIHVVGYGQTLWAIAMAYGVTIDQIRAWNNLPAGSNDIYAGQRLLVRPASMVTRLPPSATAVMADAPAITITETPLPTLTAAVTTSMALADPRLAGPANPVGIVPSTGAPESTPDLLLPLIAAASILIGCALLFFLLPLRKTP